MTGVSIAKEPAFLLGAKPGYRSAFGGLWIDRNDWESLLEGKLRVGKITSEMAEKLRFWRAHGYITFERAVPDADIDRLRADIDRAWREKDDRFLVQVAHGAYVPLSKSYRRQPLVKLLDVYAHSEAGRRV